MTPRKTMDIWAFWQQSQLALDDLNELMQILAQYASQDDLDPPLLEPPAHLVKQVKRAAAKFQENFTLMVREQKRKAGR